jgi:hypothetical protein
MAVPDRYYGPLFDKIGDSRFWAQAARLRAACDPSVARTENMPKHVFRNPDEPLHNKNANTLTRARQ